ncbi:restriction endonuclease subunit S [Rhodococcus sp. O3]|uniref:restriction endonuclease subunit S n=1 Tax=Rhodococcus sp. O3 TaxID=3404919 RepID=UPI003B66EFFE
MSRIDELIAELAPKGVKHVPLSAVTGYSNTRVDASELDETNFVGVDNLISNKGGKTDASYLPNTARLTAYEAGDILLGNIRPYLKKVWFATESGGCSGDVLAIRISNAHRESIEPKFLYYLLSSDGFFVYNMQHAKGAKMPRGNKEAILNFRIPIPPLDVQREIVRVLNQFTELEAGLEAELEARRRQYIFYRDSLLLATDAPKVAMGELGTFIRGRRFTKNDVVESGIPSIHYGEIYTDYGVSASCALREVRSDLASRLRFAQPRDVIFAGVGETVEDVGKAVAWLGDEPVAVHDDTFSFTSDMNPKYVAYAVQTGDFHSQKANYVARGKVKRLSALGLTKIKIPVPSAEEQERIVSILDKFDALLHDPSIGLPAELTARRTQYEYYRDKLLSFEESVT